MKTLMHKQTTSYDIIEDVAYNKSWYDQNKEEINADRRQKYAADPVYRLEQIDRAKKYRVDNLERVKTTKRLYGLQNRATETQRSQEWLRKRIAVVYEQLGNQCIDCGFSGLPSLQIHHKFGKEKKRDWLKVDFDLTKLELLCANCHYAKHYKDSKVVR